MRVYFSINLRCEETDKIKDPFQQHKEHHYYDPQLSTIYSLEVLGHVPSPAYYTRAMCMGLS